MAEDEREEERWALQRLHERGALSDVEFGAAMARITGDPQPRPVFDAPLPPLPDPGPQPQTAPAAPQPTGSGQIATWSTDATPADPVRSSAPAGPPPGWSHQPATDPAPPIDPMADVQVPPRLAAAGQRVSGMARDLLLGGAGGPLWIAAATAVAVVSVLQALLVVVFAGDSLDEVVANPVRAVVAVFAVTAPAALHATIGQSSGDAGLGGVHVTTNAPPTLLTVLLLATFAVMARRHWRRQPPQSLRGAGLELLRAVLALTVVAVLAALLTTVAGSLFVGQGPQLRAGLWSTAWWAAVFGTTAGAAAIAPLLPTSHVPPRPLRLEGLAALRGAVTGTVGLLALALLLIVAISIREAVIADGRGVVEGTAAIVLLLPTALVIVAGMTLAVPVTVALPQSLGSGGPVASVGLTGIEGLSGIPASVPAWLWAVVVASAMMLVLAGAGATWRAAAEGVRATRAGMAVGPVMALLWLLLGLVASTSVDLGSGGGAATLLRLLGLDAPGTAAGDVRIGLSLGLLAAVLLVFGTLAGWLGSLLAKRLWGRAPRWILTATGGRPASGWPP